MKKIVQLFMLMCTGLLIGQVCILALSYFKGNITKDTFVDIMATLNGIDIQSAKIAAALKSSKEQPAPTLDQLAEKRQYLSTELDTRESNLAKEKSDLKTERDKLETERTRFEERVSKWEEQLKKYTDSNTDEGLQKVKELYANMSPDQIKSQILLSWTKGDEKQKDDVIAILRDMDPDTQKKVLKQFAGEDAKLEQIIDAVRKAPQKIIEEAKNKAAETAKK